LQNKNIFIICGTFLPFIILHMAADPKQAVLSEALKNIEKQFGK
jgi:hypothetical protein